MARILVADDNLEQLELQHSLLGAMGYQVNTAQSPGEALRKLASEVHDLVLVDLRFPDVADGLALIRDIRSAGHTVPVILLSGWPDELYGSPEEAMVTRIVMKGSVRELLKTISELTGPAAACPPVV